MIHIKDSFWVAYQLILDDVSSEWKALVWEMNVIYTCPPHLPTKENVSFI